MLNPLNIISKFIKSGNKRIIELKSKKINFRNEVVNLRLTF